MSYPTSFDRVALSKGGDVKPRPTSFDLVLPKGDAGMSRPTSFDRMCYLKTMIACHARRRSTVCVIQRRRWHATPDIIQSCLLSKGDDGMPRLTSSDYVS